MDAPPLEAPFPLKRRFRRRFVPALIGFIGIALVIIGLSGRAMVEAIYLELAQRRAQTIQRAVADAGGPAWDHLMAGRALEDLRRTGDAWTLADGTEQYELYVPVFDARGALGAVLELYEPVSFLDTPLARAVGPLIAIPGLLFLILGVTLDRLVSTAQADIDNRTRLINELRRRLESFVSSSAADAARDAAAGDIPSRRVTTTLFFSDVRDCTGFSEPSAVVHNRWG